MILCFEAQQGAVQKAQVGNHLHLSKPGGAQVGVQKQSREGCRGYPTRSCFTSVFNVTEAGKLSIPVRTP